MVGGCGGRHSLTSSDKEIREVVRDARRSHGTPNLPKRDKARNFGRRTRVKKFEISEGKELKFRKRIDSSDLHRTHSLSGVMVEIIE